MPNDFVVPKEIQDSELASEYIDECLRCHELYERMIGLGITHQHSAYILPKSTITKVTITGNFRTWYEYLPKRECKRAMPEHRELAKGFHTELAKAVPEIFDRNFMGCKHCIEAVKCKFH